LVIEQFAAAAAGVGVTSGMASTSATTAQARRSTIAERLIMTASLRTVCSTCGGGTTVAFVPRRKAIS
jgi:hypothetical protein